ncbi:MAG: adenylate/guanylate cyclase domain-containing protein [Solirubrobacterales bacterium]
MEVLLTVLAVLGCIVMMGAAMVVLPRVGNRLQRSPRARRAMARLRRQSAIYRVLSWVEDERPDVRRATAPDGTVTILFTDIEGSTAINERLGDRRWIEVLRAHNSIVRDCVREHRGYEVKAQGDGFMIAYPSARRALECAVEMQRKLASGDGALGEPLRVRIGLHTGEAIREGDDFYGRSVTLAARLGDEAAGGEILASSIVRDLVGSAGEIPFEDAGALQLKGIRGRQRAYRVRWEEPEDARPTLRAVG